MTPTPPTLVGGADHPDAELIRLCAEFDALEAKLDELHDPNLPSYIPEGTQRDAALDVLYHAQCELAMKVNPIRALTYDGLAAKLRSFVAYDREILKPGGGTPGEIVLTSACLDAMERAGA